MRGLPDARVLVLSIIPDLARLWEVGKDSAAVRRVWQSSGVCQSMLAGPTDTSAAAQARRIGSGRGRGVDHRPSRVVEAVLDQAEAVTFGAGDL